MHGFHECYSKIITQVITLNRSIGVALSSIAKPKQITKDITHVGKNIFTGSRTVIAGIFQTFMAIGIIELSFLRIAQHLIGLGRLFETGLGFGISGITIRMIFHCQLTI